MHTHKADWFCPERRPNVHYAGKLEARGREKRFWKGMKHPPSPRRQSSCLQHSLSARFVVPTETADATFTQAGSNLCIIADFTGHVDHRITPGISKLVSSKFKSGNTSLHYYWTENYVNNSFGKTTQKDVFF